MKIYRAIDLFAGIGGIRLGFEQAFESSIKFVFSCEIDENCRKTYRANFDEIPEEDIREYPIPEIEDFDILLAGFPCQSFSRAGKRKGFKGKRGNLFFYIKEILEEKQPEAFFLENVDNLLVHDKGRTFLTIRNILESELKYYLHIKIINAVNFGLAQNRKRIYIIGFKKNLQFKFPKGENDDIKLELFLEEGRREEKYYLSQQYLNTLKKHKERHTARGNGFGYEKIDPKGIANTLVGGGMGLERNLIEDEIFYDPWQPGDNPFKKKNNEGLRKLTERECANLQGFPDNFTFPVVMTQAYKQIANSVPIPVVKAIAKEMKKSLDEEILLKTKRNLQFNLYNYI